MPTDVSLLNESEDGTGITTDYLRMFKRFLNKRDKEETPIIRIRCPLRNYKTRFAHAGQANKLRVYFGPMAGGGDSDSSSAGHKALVVTTR